MVARRATRFADVRTFLPTIRLALPRAFSLGLSGLPLFWPLPLLLSSRGLSDRSPELLLWAFFFLCVLADAHQFADRQVNVFVAQQRRGNAFASDRIQG